MIKVPFVDFSKIPKEVLEELKRTASEVIDAGYFVGGPLVTQFEEAWSKAIGSSYAVGVGNGLDGLVIALKALGIGKGDLVAVPTHTFIATWNAVVLVGATPIGIDVDRYGLLNLSILESDPRKFSAVIPVHMHGMMVDMSRLNQWASQNSVRVIEDASQAHLAYSRGVFAGTASDVGVFSLYPSKNLGALGDSGVNVTNSLELAEKMRSYRNYGAANSDKYLHTTFGVNSRLDSIQAAFLTVNLRYLAEWNRDRSRLADVYLKNLIPNESFAILNPGSQDSVWHHFAILTRKRTQLQKYLIERGVQTEIHYPHLASAEFARIANEVPVPAPLGEYLARHILSLPISPWHTNEQILHVCNVLNNFNGQPT
jgi:dTDP-4-amino-4,6-dideoxygalactose transaminase